MAAMSGAWFRNNAEMLPMELPHWLMAAGTFLVVVGFVGAALYRNARTTSDTDD
jgi:hypothetical protein